MNYRLINTIVLTISVVALNGCASVSKMTASLAQKKKTSETAKNPEQMRISVDSVVLQPLTRVDVPHFSGLQTPLVGGTRQRDRSSGRSITLPRFTPVKVLSNNGRSALVETSTGDRGYIPAASIASESSILAAAQPAEPVRSLYGNGIDPATGLPYDPSALYVPRMDPSDSPVDATMLNNVDSVDLPESETSSPTPPEAFNIDGVLIRQTAPTPVTPAPADVTAQ